MKSDPLARPDGAAPFSVPPGIFWLGVVSLLTDLSSEMIFSVLSIFLTVTLGASSALLGVMEGLADFSSSSLDYVSGYFSDKTGRRKTFAVAGYLFSAISKAILPFTGSAAWVVVFRVVERLGKSIRGAPRDALMVSLSKKSRRGASFGFHGAMDKSGAVIGPLVAYFLLSKFGQDLAGFHKLFLVAVIPALLAVLVMGVFVREDKNAEARRDGMEQMFFSVYKKLSPALKSYLKIAAFFSLGYFGFAFLLLKAYQVGFKTPDIALLYALFNASYVLVSIPVGRLGDRIGRSSLILIEYGLYGLMCTAFMFAQTKAQTVVLFVVYGMFFAIDESQTKVFVSDLSSTEVRGSALGLYNFITGMGYLPASLIVGALWQWVSPQAAFAWGALVAICAFFWFLSQKAVFVKEVA
ncbi:MAG: MFS transporter [Oligoflexia bacterium]|nr:MFS transporter [Oligoflexia bacterium]